MVSSPPGHATATFSNGLDSVVMVLASVGWERLDLAASPGLVVRVGLFQTIPYALQDALHSAFGAAGLIADVAV
jgi:hypothetical protein